MRHDIIYGIAHGTVFGIGMNHWMNGEYGTGLFLVAAAATSAVQMKELIKQRKVTEQ